MLILSDFILIYPLLNTVRNEANEANEVIIVDVDVSRVKTICTLSEYYFRHYSRLREGHGDLYYKYTRTARVIGPDVISSFVLPRLRR